MHQQITFPLSSNDAYNLDEYIESSSNRLAADSINNWRSNWGVNPYPKTLIIEGAKSSGKTFLAKRWEMLSGALFLKNTYELTESILNHHKGFVIDGLNEAWDEEKLLHHFNTLNENKKYLLITVNGMPKIRLPDLSSRINASRKINLGIIDDNLMKILIFKIFSNNSVKVGDEVINYLIKTLPREFYRIINSVNKVNCFAITHKRKITLPLIKEVL